MTERRQWVRVLLYGCVHRPKLSAMAVPKTGETMLCRICRRQRVVIGVETGWANAVVKCRECGWKISAENRDRKRLFGLAQRHADARGHVVIVRNDAADTLIRPKVGQQLPLIDDLLLP